MDNKILILGIALALSPLAALAQGTVSDLERDIGARISIEVDKKISKGFHAGIEAEARISDNFGNFGRYQAGAGLTYKVNPWLKVGGGYLFIEKRNTSYEWKQRHRIYGDVMGTVRSGDWQFSLKERLQLTHREVGNEFQNNPNSLTLKSRLKVSYKGISKALTPYIYAEARNVFNDPACKATWSGSEYSDYEFLGYSDAYFNRARGCIGLEWKMDKHNSLDFFLLGDYCYDKEIDTNAEGTKLKSLTYDQALNFNLGIGYKFSF